MAAPPAAQSRDAKAAAAGLRNVDLEGATDDAVETVAEQVARFARLRLKTDRNPPKFKRSETHIEINEEAEGRQVVAITSDKGWAGGAEWGAIIHTVFGRRIPMHKFPGTLTKMWNVHVSFGGTKDGYILGYAWKLYEARADDKVASEVDAEIDDSLTRNGLA